MPISLAKDKNLYLKENLESVLASNTRIASPLSFFLAFIFIFTVSQLKELNLYQWISGVVLFVGLGLRTWWGFHISKNWHFIFTGINLIVSLGWSSTLTLAFLAADDSMAISNLTYAVTAGLVASTPHSLSLSRRDFLVFLSFILSPLLVGFYLASQGSLYLFSGIFIVSLFALFLIKQRTQQEKVWKELQLFNYELQILLDKLPVGVAVVKEGLLTRTNALFNRVLQLSKNDPFSRAALQNLIEHSCRQPSERMSSEILLPVDGNQKEIHLSVAHTVQGHHHHETIITLVNVNDNRSLEIEIQKQKMQIEQSAKMAALGVMSSGLAHEINNPLATISGRVQLMHMVLQKIESQIDSSTYEKLTKSLEVMQKTVLRISKIIKGLRSFARETEGDPFETVSMKDVVESTLSFCESRFSSRGIEVQVNVGAELEFHGRGTEISQVLLNALNNSFDAIENSPEKWIKLVAQKVADKIIIKIQDSGPGIPQALRDKVMIPFFTTKEVGKGTGLGLSLSRGLVETHGGRMYFDFSSSCTELVIELPVIQNPTKAQQVKAS